MLRKIGFGMMLSLLLIGILTLTVCNPQVKAESATIYVDDDNASGPWDGTAEYPYRNITSALGHASSGNIIYIKAGTYYEKVVVSKQVSLIGENRDTAIVDGNGTGTVIQMTSYVNVFNLAIRNAGRVWGSSPDSCILGRYVGHIRIENNSFTNAAVCVTFMRSSLVNISSNIVYNATYIGILGYSLNNGTIFNNSVSDCGYEGIHLDGGCTYCSVINNTVKNGFDGISLETDTDSLSTTANNLIEGNNILNNELAGIGIWKCNNNVFRRNNVTNCGCNLLIWGFDLMNFMQDIDDSNTADNKTLYYLTNCHNLLIQPSNYPNLGFIALVNCTNIMIRDFDLTSNGDGILLASSTNCTLMNVTLSNNREFSIYGGFPLVYGGLTFFQSNNNTIIDCRVCNNSYGVCLYHSDWNVFYHNSFDRNDRQVFPDFYSVFQNVSSGYFSISSWDNGFEGNYWSDCVGTDENEDGIGDSPYLVASSPTNPEMNQYDRYPLMGMFHSYDASYIVPNCKVTVVSNSTISNFVVENPSPEGRVIKFNVVGEGETIGFCRVCIPHALLSPPYKVIIDGEQTPVIHYNGTVFYNGTHTWIYFTYQHSEHSVAILSEFSPAIILPLFMILSMLTVVFAKRKHPSSRI